jgi:hypothetical protein
VAAESTSAALDLPFSPIPRQGSTTNAQAIASSPGGGDDASYDDASFDLGSPTHK